ncbi:ferritin family protein [Nonomuraea sp. B1E8]|uniref:ferritin family protein n=1 Tax=unclassified Nonomuraea TaxID=2593643 RepID=UPI00325F09FE
MTALSAAAAVVAPGGAIAAAYASEHEDLHPSTRENVREAMEGEAFAYASYRAYAVQAGREHLRQVRRVYEQTADVELNEHFAEQGELTGLVGDNAANLRDAISGESYEATTMYRQFAAQARQDGDTEAAERFAEIAEDEADHRATFVQALRAITHPSSGATIPTDVTAEPVSIPAGGPRVSSRRTLRNLETAMRGEALAYAKYTFYARQAKESGQPRLAMLFWRTAQVELTEHFAEEATLAGLVRDTATNLRTSIKGEIREGRQMYPHFAREAASAGDHEAAALLAETGRDELAHARRFAEVGHRRSGA